MRTNIEIDDALMASAMAAGPYKTKRETVEASLKLIARQKAYQGLLALRGKVDWRGPDEAWAEAKVAREPRETYGAKSTRSSSKKQRRAAR